MTKNEVNNYMGKNVFYTENDQRVLEGKLVALRGDIVSFEAHGFTDHYVLETIRIRSEVTPVASTTTEKTNSGETLIEG
jgi:hypothetical protein